MAQINKLTTIDVNDQPSMVDGIGIAGDVFIKDYSNSNHRWNNIHNHNQFQMDPESLLQLEQLINEFFQTSTTNERKRQIEVILAEFSNTQNSWQMSFLYFEQTTNEYTKMYCLTVIETFINHRWHTLPNDLRNQFRQSLWKHLFENHSIITPPIRNKFCKILVHIARYDWPNQYPDFMSNILELLTPDPGQNIIHSATLILLGLNLLGTAVEELTTNNCHNYFSSRIELIRMLQSNLPNMFQALTLLLESIISKHVNYSATPPPSPTSNNPSDSGGGGSPANILSNITKTHDTLGNVFQLSLKKGLLNSIPEMDHEFVHLTSQIFVCLSRIIDFMPVNYYHSINSTLLSALYVLATFGSMNSSHSSAKLGLISINCINELMSKASAFNSEANEFIYNVFQNTFLILKLIVTNTLTKTLSSQTTNGVGETFVKLDEIDEEYLKKFIDFLKLFISNHLGRFEKFISFPTKDFLQLLFEFTTKMCHSTDCYLMLLDTWSVYFDYLENYMDSKHKDRLVSSEKFDSIKEPIFSFLVFLIRSIQYSCNGDYLKHLDDQQPEEDGRTELENHLYQSVEIIAKIAEIFQDEAIGFIDNYFAEKLQNIYYGLEFLVNNNKPLFNGEKLYHPLFQNNHHDHHHHHNHPQNNDKNNCDLCMRQPMELQLQLRIQDFIIMLQVFSRLSPVFIDNGQFEKYFIKTRLLFDKLCEILHFIELHKFDDLFRSSNQTLSGEFLSLKAQIMATFKAYIVWFQRVCCCYPANGGDYSSNTNHNADSQNKSTEMAQAIEYLTIIINTCCTIICDTVNSIDSLRPCPTQMKMFHSAALTLNSFSSNVRPSFVFQLTSVQRLFDQHFQQNLLNLNAEPKLRTRHSPSLIDQILISQAITNFLILPWFQVSNEAQSWDRRSLLLNIFIGQFLQLFNELDLCAVSNDNDDGVDINSINGMDPSANESTELSRKCPNVYCRSLYILKQVIESHSDSPMKSKQLLLLSLNSSLEAFIQLLVQNRLLHSTVMGCQITKHILALFIVVFKVLLARVHTEFVERTIQALLQIINHHDVMNNPGRIVSNLSDNSNTSDKQPNANFCSSSSSDVSIRQTIGLRVIIKFLKLLILVIGQTSLSSFLRGILPEIINFTVLHIQNNLISLKSTLSMYFRNTCGSQYDTYHKLLKVYYRFLYELLFNNSRYFFPNRLNHQHNVMDAKSSSSTNINDNGGGLVDLQQQKHFETIMEIFGESFMQPENINLFKQNIEALELLNFKLKLYERPMFKEKFWERFIYLFMQTLLDHCLNLLNESLFTIIYHLAQVDFYTFYHSFIPKFITNLSRLSDPQRMELIQNFKMDCSLSSSSSSTSTLSANSNGQLAIDLPTFSSKLNQLICDLNFFYKCNTI